jgi:hypothetical protein
MAMHVFFFTGLGLLPTPSEALAAHEMQFEVIAPEPPKPPPEPEEAPEPEAPPEPEPQRPARAKEPAPEPEPEPETPPEQVDGPVEEAVTDFTGVTLTAEGSGGWSTVVGSGKAMKGPIGKIAGQEGTKTEEPVKKPRPPQVVAPGDLSKRPTPPPQGKVNALLQKNFPPRARSQGVEGQAVLRVRIQPSGRLGRMTTERETPAGWGFAAACRQTLQQAGSWGGPIGPGGRRVATDIKYTCRFEVMY